jgi:hypothetical protein
MLIGGRGKRIGEGFIIITILVVVILLIAVITVSVKKEGLEPGVRNCKCHKGFKKISGKCQSQQVVKTCKNVQPDKKGVYGNHQCLGNPTGFQNSYDCVCDSSMAC